MRDKKRILILEPYFGGSHRQFLEGLSKTIEAEYTWLTLPARKWKMRMQLSALWFIEQIKTIPADKRCFDAVLCSTFVDVSVLRASLSQLEWWNSKTKIITYFHENQFVYPSRIDDRGMFQFTAINFLTALMSDGIAFNSVFNQNSFLDGCAKYLKKTADMNIRELLDRIQEKCQVIYPGMDLYTLDTCLKKKKARNRVPVIVWNHRWEHDKGPRNFFNALYRLQNEGLDFRLILLGQSFKNAPGCFAEAKIKLQEKIDHFGYVESYEEYVRLLSQGDIAVSTAQHEFFGIAVIEAIRAGCRPLLPDRLAYPELYDEQYLYKEKGLYGALKECIAEQKTLSMSACRHMTDQFNWSYLKERYEHFLFGEGKSKSEG